MKTVLITGHTKGLGKAIYDELQTDHRVIGVSRGTGQDICDLNVEDYRDVDILINNAYHQDCQFYMLRDFYEMWKGQEKTIVNIGTAGIDLPNRPLETLEYNASKKKLEAYSRWISDNDKVLRCMMLSPGFMVTELVLSRMEHWSEEEKQKHTSKSLDMCYVARMVRMVIESPHKIRDLQLLP
jgi:NAD(P)-dependent dehydrogenase (short-subunit alcohol dehydrogenase family)